MANLNKKDKAIIENNQDNINYNGLDKFIESNIENKLNSLLETLPDKIEKDKEHTDFYDLSLKDIYKNTLQSIIDIINDVTKAYNNGYIDNSNYIYVLIDILSKEERRLYIGIILIFLSFIIYFIDGASV
jgi:hypothetical protein